MTREVFNRKISLLTSKLNIKVRKKLVRCYVWSVALYGSETWKLKTLQWKYLGSFLNMVLEENGEDKIARDRN